MKSLLFLGLLAVFSVQAMPGGDSLPEEENVANSREKRYAGMGEEEGDGDGDKKGKGGLDVDVNVNVNAPQQQMLNADIDVDVNINAGLTTPSECLCEDNSGQHLCGSVWDDPDVPCVWHQCDENEMIATSMINCPALFCLGEEIYFPDACCPICSPITTPGCGSNGNTWRDPDEPCIFHSCENGEINTYGVTCAPAPCPPRDGECCPSHDCTTTTPACDSNGDTWTDPDEPCTFHSCEDGVIVTYWATCAPAPCPPKPGECCPTYDCTTIPETTEIEGCFCEDEFGRHPCRTGWGSPFDSCIEYICENGEIRVGDCPIEYCPPDPTPYDLRCCPGCSSFTTTTTERTDTTTLVIADTTA